MESMPVSKVTRKSKNMSQFQRAAKNPSTAKVYDSIRKSTIEAIAASFHDNHVDDSVRLELAELWKRNMEDMGLTFDERPNHHLAIKNTQCGPQSKALVVQTQSLDLAEPTTGTTDIECENTEMALAIQNENEVPKEDEAFLIAEYTSVFCDIATGETNVVLKGGGVLHVNGKEYVFGRGDGKAI